MIFRKHRAPLVVILGALFLVLFPARATAQSQSRAEAPVTSTAPGGNAASITFRKVFKSSYPEFVEIKINESGSGTYDIRQLDEDPNPQPFQVATDLAQRIFDLAAKLHDFDGVDLEVHHRIANLGEKTFRYQMGSETHEVSFNYTLDANASQLLGIFEGLSREEMELSDLQRTMRYDHLGVNDVLLQIESDYNGKLLPDPGRFLPLLNQVAGDEKFINIARDKARDLANRIQPSKP